MSVDLSLLDVRRRRQLDALGELIDAGLGLFAGRRAASTPADGAQPPSAVAAAQQVTDVWRRLGFPLDRLAAQVVVTPTCGLAGAAPEYARAALVRVCRGRPAARRPGMTPTLS